MKILNKVLALILLAVCSISCGDDDDLATPHSEQIACVWTIPIQGFADQLTTTPLKTIALKDVLGEDAAKNFTSGTFQRTAGNSIELKSSVEVPLQSITLKVGNDSFSITNFQNTAGEDVLDFLSKVFSAYTSSKSKSTTITATFTPTANIPENVSLNISIKALYNWNTY
jgi:hypothetical protein